MAFTDSERRGIAAVFATCCLAFLAWAFPNMTRLVTIPGAIICLVFAAYFLRAELEAGRGWIWRHKFVSAGVLLAVIGGGGWYVWNVCDCDTTLPPPPSPSSLPIESRMGKWLFTCAVYPIDFEDWADFYRKKFVAKDEANGFLVSISTDDGVLHFEKEALTAKAKKIEGGNLAARGFTKVIIEARTISKTEMGITAEFVIPSDQRSVLLVKPDPASKEMIEIRQEVEGMFGLP
jgi:hypothetical protein